MIDQEHLISVVREQRSLWDKRHKNYRNRVLTKRAWKNVADSIGCTSDEAQSKWKNLRDSFSRELKKVTKRRSGTDAEEVAEYTGDWLYFDAMQFLKGVIRTRKNAHKTTNVRKKSVEETDTIDEESVISVLSDSTGASSTTDNQTNLQNELESFSNRLATEIQCGLNQSTSASIDNHFMTPDMSQKDYSNFGMSCAIGNNNIKQSDFAEVFAELERQKIDLMKKEIEFQEDEDMNWFKSILPHLRTLPPFNKFLFRTKVQEMLLNELTNLNVLQAGPSTIQMQHPPNTIPSDTIQ